MAKDTPYATVSWHPCDIQDIRPNWTIEQCEAFLGRNAGFLSSRLIELGWQVIETYIEMDEADGKT
jgi:hypothetical protein